MENFEKEFGRGMEGDREKIDEVFPERIKQKFIRTIQYSMPVAIEQKIVREVDGDIDIEYSRNLTGASYFWLVRFDNGFRVPYPLMNLEGVDSNPYKYGERMKTEEEKKDIIQKESVIRLCYRARKNLKKKFEELQKDAFRR